MPTLSIRLQHPEPGAGEELIVALCYCSRGLDACSRGLDACSKGLDACSKGLDACSKCSDLSKTCYQQSERFLVSSHTLDASIKH